MKTTLRKKRALLAALFAKDSLGGEVEVETASAKMARGHVIPADDFNLSTPDTNPHSVSPRPSSMPWPYMAVSGRVASLALLRLLRRERVGFGVRGVTAHKGGRTGGRAQTF